jgi:hypothetical protein
MRSITRERAYPAIQVSGNNHLLFEFQSQMKSNQIKIFIFLFISLLTVDYYDARYTVYK